MGKAFAEIGRLFTLAYSDAMRLIRGMWRAIGMMLLAFLAVGVLTGLIAMQMPTALGQAVLEILGSVAAIWLTAPYFIALYRFVWTGVAVRAESLRATEASKLFFAWSATLTFVLSIPSIVYALLGPTITDLSEPVPDTPGLWLSFVLSIVIWVFAVRTVTLLPAVANGKRPTLRSALAESRGYFWFIIGAGAAIGLPLMLGTLVAVVVMTAMFGPASPIVTIPLILLAGVVLAQASISLSARLYQKLSPDSGLGPVP